MNTLTKLVASSFLSLGVVMSASAASHRVDAAVNWTKNVGNEGRAYLFGVEHPTKYVPYPFGSHAPSAPATDTQSGWNLPSSWGGQVDAAVNWGKGYTYLFRGTEYVRYDIGANKPASDPKDTSGWNLPSSWGGQVDAAVNWGNGSVYLFSGTEYVR